MDLMSKTLGVSAGADGVTTSLMLISKVLGRFLLWKWMGASCGQLRLSN